MFYEKLDYIENWVALYRCITSNSSANVANICRENTIDGQVEVANSTICQVRRYLARSLTLLFSFPIHYYVL
jgi:hypothetical protein